MSRSATTPSARHTSSASRDGCATSPTARWPDTSRATTTPSTRWSSGAAGSADGARAQRRRTRRTRLGHASFDVRFYVGRACRDHVSARSCLSPAALGRACDMAHISGKPVRPRALSLLVALVLAVARALAIPGTANAVSRSAGRVAVLGGRHRLDVVRRLQRPRRPDLHVVRRHPSGDHRRRDHAHERQRLQPADHRWHGDRPRRRSVQPLERLQARLLTYVVPDVVGAQHLHVHRPAG